MKKDKIIEHTKPGAEPLATGPAETLHCTAVHAMMLYTARSWEGEGCALYTASSTTSYGMHSQIIPVLPQSNTGALHSAASMP